MRCAGRERLLDHHFLPAVGEGGMVSIAPAEHYSAELSFH